ncbi:MAG: DUF4838 domain-containing protein [Pirellulales bacterium]
MVTLVGSTIILFAICGAVEADDSALTLIRNGEPASIIVTAAAPSTAARQGAEDLQMWLRRMSDAIVPIQSEDTIAENDNRTVVLVGDTQRTRSLGIRPDSLQLEEIIVRTFPGALVIIGDDKSPDGRALGGTQSAVHTFAENVLGVHLLWPGELGEVVPHRPTVVARDIDIRVKPMLVDRRMVNLVNNGVTHTKLDALGWDRETYRQFQKTSDLWFRFHRIGGSYNGSFGHAFGHYWQRFHQEHPDWFALQPDGTRDNSQPEHALYEAHRLCISNPELIKQVANDCIEQLEKNPSIDAVSVSPNDGGPRTFCLCDRCEAWDAPEGETVQMRTLTGRIPHVSLTDRFVRFYSAVAEIVSKQLPDRNIGAYAYHLYTRAPIDAKLHPNVVIGFVPGSKIYLNDDARETMRDSWDKWSQAAHKLFLRPNSLMALHALPTVYVHRLGEDMRFFADHNMLFARYDCNFHHWATNGLNYYVLAKLLWNPHANVEELVDEYCAAGFGPAAETIRRYFDRIEQITNAVAAQRERPSPETIARHYSDDVLAELGKMLDEADQKSGDEALIKERIAFLRKGLEYAPICRDYLVAKEAGRNGDKWQWRSYLEQSVRRTTWFQNLGPSRVIHAPWLIYWDW